MFSVSNEQFAVLFPGVREERCKIQLRQDIAVHQEEEFVLSKMIPYQRKGPSSAQRGRLLYIADSHAEFGAITAKGLDQLRLISSRQNQLGNARCPQLFDDELQNRLFTHGQQRLGNRESERSQPRA